VVVNNLDVLKIIKEHNVILVLQGHLHVKELILWQHTKFIGGGAICGKWWRGPWHGTEEGFSVITLTGNTVSWEYIDYGWESCRPKRNPQGAH
jgi:Icc protein